MLTSKRERSVAYEQQAKFIQERIIFTERNFGELCNVFAEYIRKAGRLRDKCDDVAKIAMNFAESEDVNKTSSNGLANFAYCLSILGDFGDLRVQKLETKVIAELSQYETICKNSKEEVKQIFNVRDREIARKRQLDRIRERNPRNRQQITQAETELLKATAEVSRTIHGLEEQTNNFEKRKLHDLKNVLLQFIMVEMAYHAKALEVLTKTYQEVNEIDEEGDLQEFRKGVRAPDTIPHFKPKRDSKFKSSQSLGSLNTLSSTPKKQKSGLKRPNSTDYLSKSNETLESVDIEHVQSADSVAGTESENSAASDVANKFLARKHRVQRK